MTLGLKAIVHMAISLLQIYNIFNSKKHGISENIKPAVKIVFIGMVTQIV